MHHDERSFMNCDIPLLGNGYFRLTVLYGRKGRRGARGNL
jgi:hypothetical protein